MLNLFSLLILNLKASGGFELGVGVGAIVVPSATVAIPSVSVNKANGGQSKYSSGKFYIKGGDVTIKIENKLALQGTNIAAKNNVGVSANNSLLQLKTTVKH